MKKRIFLLLILILALCLAACGQKQTEKEPVDLQAVYDSLTGQMPEMMVLDETMQLNLLGVDAADCEQVITAICADSMRVDEVWLLKAKDQTALEKLTELAKVRVESQAEVCQSYAPDQYAIVQKAQIVSADLYLALLIGPEASAMKTTVETALGNP